MVDIAEGIEIMLKWKRAKDAAIVLLGSEYGKYMSDTQKLIKDTVFHEGTGIITTVLELAKALEGDSSIINLILLAAGYELACNNDFTV